MEKEKLIEMLYNEVSPYCFKKNLKELKVVLEKSLEKIEALELEEGSPDSNSNALALFIDAKRIEGCSERTL
ncbi:MAG: integrase, partial [Bacilli bacterium]|nr:integrase [Bacilli bacterium]